MKVGLVKDENGKVVATFESNPAAAGLSIRPVLKSGHTLHEVEAKEDYGADIKAFYERHSQ
jgi:hypothetical protein